MPLSKMSSKSKKKKVVSKDELRQLMKQQRGAQNLTAGRIESPLARYNALDQLSCIICNTPVKNEKLWNVHLMSKSHKLNVENFKKDSERKAQQTVAPLPSGVKRKPNDDSGVPTKISKSSNNSNMGLASYGSSSEDEAMEEEQTPDPPAAAAAATSSSSVPGGLPADFFDKGLAPASSTDEEPQKVHTMAEQIPEGFFDDPVMDAKVRKVEYKDKMDEEWEMFQRAMKEEAQVSAAIVDEEDEIKVEERNIEEIDDQMRRLAKVTELAKAKEELMAKEKEKASSSDQESDVDEQDFEEFLDWRSKKAWTS